MERFLSRKFLSMIGGVVILTMTAWGIEEETAQAAVGAGIAFIIAIYNVSQGLVDREAAKNGG